MKVELYLGIEIRDKSGQLKEYRKHRANSLCMNFIDILSTKITGTNQSVTDTGGTGRTVSRGNSIDFSADAASATATYGIRVGTGTNAVVLTDTALQTFIAHGTGSGNLSHGSHTMSSPVTSGSSRQFTVQRTFTNNSGAGITVNEVALIITQNNAAWYFLIDRTLSTFTINNGATATVTYTLKVTV